MSLVCFFVFTSVFLQLITLLFKTKQLEAPGHIHINGTYFLPFNDSTSSQGEKGLNVFPRFHRIPGTLPLYLKRKSNVTRLLVIHWYKQLPRMVFRWKNI